MGEVARGTVTERGRAIMPSQSPYGDSSPKVRAFRASFS